MNWIFYAAIGLFILIRFLRKANPNKDLRRPAPVQQQRPSVEPPSVPAPPRQRQTAAAPPPVPGKRQVYTPAMARAEANHFSEERLVDEFRRTHAQGKTIKHHVHDYFDEEKDRSKSRGLEARKKKHFVVRALRKKNGFKQAVVLAEILKRPE